MHIEIILDYHKQGVRATDTVSRIEEMTFADNVQQSDVENQKTLLLSGIQTATADIEAKTDELKKLAGIPIND